MNFFIILLIPLSLPERALLRRFVIDRSAASAIIERRVATIQSRNMQTWHGRARARARIHNIAKYFYTDDRCTKCAINVNIRVLEARRLSRQVDYDGVIFIIVTMEKHFSEMKIYRVT